MRTLLPLRLVRRVPLINQVIRCKESATRAATSSSSWRSPRTLAGTRSGAVCHVHGAQLAARLCRSPVCPVMIARYFFLDDFSGDCLSTAFQARYQADEGCDVVVSARGSGEHRVRAHSQVLAFWSRRFEEIVRERQEKRLISPEDPLLASISCSDFTTITLLIDIMYYGSVCVSDSAVAEFLAQAAKMALSLHEEQTLVTPDTREQRRRWLRRTAAADKGAAAPRLCKRRPRGRPQERTRARLACKRKACDRTSSPDDEEHDEERPCKRIRAKSEMENQIQLSPGTGQRDQGCDLLDLSIVPTLDSDAETEPEPEPAQLADRMAQDKGS